MKLFQLHNDFLSHFLINVPVTVECLGVFDVAGYLGCLLFSFPMMQESAGRGFSWKRFSCKLMKRFVVRASFGLLITALLVVISACQKQEKTSPDAFPPVRYLYAGNQGENKFQMWIWIPEDETIPALVRSGMCRYLDDQFIDTDEEHLSYQFTEDGFTLSDPATRKVLYTATHVKREGEPTGFRVQITWDHAPGAAWEAYAKEMGWLQEMTLQMQIFEGADIVY